MKYQHDLHLYQVEVPGALQPMDLAKELMDMKFYYDLTTSKVYYTAFSTSVADSGTKDSLFASMINRMAASSLKVLTQKNIVKQGYEGREVVFKVNEQQVMHIQVYLAGRYAYTAMMLCKQSDINDNDSKRFFESFIMTPGNNTAPKPYILYRDTAAAFSVLMPHTPSVSTQKELPDGSGDLTLYTATDFSSGSSYALSVRNTKPGTYFSDDSSFFAESKETLLRSLKDDAVIDTSAYNGYPAMRLSGDAKAGNIYYHILSVLRGNRVYYLVAQSRKETPAAMADSFLHSFTLNGYSPGDWKTRMAADSSFTGWLPEAIDGNDNQADTLATLPDSADVTAYPEEPVKREFLFYDKSTATSYNVQREEFSEFFYSTGDSSFFLQQSQRYMANRDSITSFILLKGMKDKAADIQIERPGSSIIKKIRFIVHGDTLYKVFTYTPRWLAATDDAQRFFSSFSINSPASPTTLFTSKTEKLITALASADSAAFYKASEYLYNANFDKSDLHAFYPLLVKPLKDFSGKAYNTNISLIKAVACIADSSTVDYILQQYTTLTGEQRKLQYPLLMLLLEMQQPYAIQAAGRLLLLPVAPGGNAGVFASALSDSLPLASTFSSRILSLTSDTAAALDYASLLTDLLDSSYITKEQVVSYVRNFINASQRQRHRIKANADNYNYKIIYMLDLLGSINNAACNAELQEYGKINMLSLRYKAVEWLIKNNQPLASDPLNKLAASETYRTDLYDALKEAKKTTRFPASQLSQRSFAASYMRNYATDQEDNEPSGIQYVMEKTISYGGKKQKFYLFKVAYKDGESMSYSLGVAGPFSISSSQVTSTNYATGVYWKENYSPRKINNQFDAYLTQLAAREE